LGQVLAWGSSYYLLAVLAKPIIEDTGWPLTAVAGGLSLGLVAAAMASPWVGRAIDQRGGRLVLVASSLLLSVGHLCLASAPNVSAYLGAWLVVGIGMGAGLYDSAFSTLGRLYGSDARSAITMLTLFGGFASTVCWPLSTILVVELGWRGTCVAYAGLHLLLALPLYWFVLPRPRLATAVAQTPEPARQIAGSGPRVERRRLILGFLMAGSMLSFMISTMLSVHLLVLLQARGIALAAAVGLGATIGPCQVGARVIELAIARFHHPIWTRITATVLVATGIAVLWSGLPIVLVALVLYGAGIGLESIARGTLPLTLFGPIGYGTLMERLAIPNLIAQASAPSIGAVLIEGIGSQTMLRVLLAAAVSNLLVAMLLFTLLRRTGSPQMSA
jgi:MFS family permease